MAARTADASDPASLAAVIRRRRQGRGLRLLLDYDGSLVPLVEDPERASPDDDLLILLTTLARTPGIEPHVVSGRTRTTLQRWLGTLPIGLHAEHGAYSRPDLASPWQAHAPASLDDMIDLARSMVAPYVVNGALLEAKELGLAWHYRAMDRHEAAQLARGLFRELRVALQDTPLTVVHGACVIEVRPRGITKGTLAASLPASSVAPVLTVAIGDDRTDEDMFSALDDGDVTIHVGDGGSRARWRLADVPAVRALLWDLAGSTGSAELG